MEIKRLLFIQEYQIETEGETSNLRLFSVATCTLSKKKKFKKNRFA